MISSAITSANGRVRVLVHELAHALGVGYEEYGREVAEVIVETATVVVCGALGLDTSGESIPYIAGWGEQDLDAIRRHAEKVDEIARALEAVCGVVVMGDPDRLGDPFRHAPSSEVKPNPRPPVTGLVAVAKRQVSPIVSPTAASTPAMTGQFASCATVLKTVDGGNVVRGFESLPLRRWRDSPRVRGLLRPLVRAIGTDPRLLADAGAR